MKEKIEIRETAIERLLGNNVALMRQVVKPLPVCDMFEISRNEDVPKFYESLRYLSDSPDRSYIVVIYELTDPDTFQGAMHKAINSNEERQIHFAQFAAKAGSTAR